MAEAKSTQLCFYPDQYPDETLKAFNNFIQTFELRYEAAYPDPPKMSMEAALERWKLTQANPAEARPSLEQYDEIKENWQAQDKVKKILGMYSLTRLFEDWVAAEPNETLRKASTLTRFLTIMREFYKPTENTTLKHYKFRSLSQGPKESFNDFCNRVEKEAKHCQFKCGDAACTTEATAVRDQIVIGVSQDDIREEALKKSLDLKDLRATGVSIEGASKGAAEISGDSAVYKA